MDIKGDQFMMILLEDTILEKREEGSVNHAFQEIGMRQAVKLRDH